MDLQCSACGSLDQCNCTVSYAEYVRLIHLLARLKDWVDYPTPPDLIDELHRAINEADVPWVPAIKGGENETR